MFHRNVGEQLRNITVLKLRVMPFAGETSKPVSITIINASHTLALPFNISALPFEETFA